MGCRGQDRPLPGHARGRNRAPGDGKSVAPSGRVPALSFGKLSRPDPGDRSEWTLQFREFAHPRPAWLQTRRPAGKESRRRTRLLARAAGVVSRPDYRPEDVWLL